MWRTLGSLSGLHGGFERRKGPLSGGIWSPQSELGSVRRGLERPVMARQRSTDRRGPESAYATVSLKKAMTFVQASSAWLSR